MKLLLLTLDKHIVVHLSRQEAESKNFSIQHLKCKKKMNLDS